MSLKELSVELQDRIVSRQISGEWYQKISAALKDAKNTVASIIIFITLDQMVIKVWKSVCVGENK